MAITLEICHHVNARAIQDTHREYSPQSDLKIKEGVNQIRPNGYLGYMSRAIEAILATT